jgi:hypothetical protein
LAQRAIGRTRFFRFGAAARTGLRGLARCGYEVSDKIGLRMTGGPRICRHLRICGRSIESGAIEWREWNQGVAHRNLLSRIGTSVTFSP